MQFYWYGQIMRFYGFGRKVHFYGNICFCTCCKKVHFCGFCENVHFAVPTEKCNCKTLGFWFEKNILVLKSYFCHLSFLTELDAPSRFTFV